MLSGFVSAHYWCEVTGCVYRTVTFDSTACDVCHSACNISRSCENVSYSHHYVYLSFAFVLASRSTCFIFTPVSIQRCNEFVHWIITVSILMWNYREILPVMAIMCLIADSPSFELSFAAPFVSFTLIRVSSKKAMQSAYSLSASTSVWSLRMFTVPQSLSLLLSFSSCPSSEEWRLG